MVIHKLNADMKRVIFMLILTLVSSVAITSCSGKRGCTDPEAINYNPEATRDNKKCEFEGSVVFWFDEEASIGLIDDGAISLTYWLDGELVGSSATSVFWTDAPACGQNASITATKNIGTRKTGNYQFEIIDQDDWTYWEGTVTIEANVCLQLQLLWSKGNKKK